MFITLRSRRKKRASKNLTSLAVPAQLVEAKKGQAATPLTEKVEDVVTVEIVGSNFKVCACETKHN